MTEAGFSLSIHSASHRCHAQYENMDHEDVKQCQRCNCEKFKAIAERESLWRPPTTLPSCKSLPSHPGHSTAIRSSRGFIFHCYEGSETSE